TEDDFDFLTSNKVWIATDRSRARRCVEACVYGTLDFVGYPRFPAPVEFIAAVIAYYVHPVNIQLIQRNQSAAFSSGKVRPNHETNINIIARRTGKDVNSHTVLDGIITTIMATIQRINIIG